MKRFAISIFIFLVTSPVFAASYQRALQVFEDSEPVSLNYIKQLAPFIIREGSCASLQHPKSSRPKAAVLFLANNELGDSFYFGFEDFSAGDTDQKILDYAWSTHSKHWGSLFQKEGRVLQEAYLRNPGKHLMEFRTFEASDNRQFIIRKYYAEEQVKFQVGGWTYYTAPGEAIELCWVKI